MWKVAFFSLCIFLTSCYCGKPCKSKDCKAYCKFIRENWKTKNDTLYYFVGNPNYWFNETYSTYVNEKCLVGLSQKQVIKLFGTPSKMFFSPKWNAFYYCLDKLCVERELNGGRFIILYFNKQKKVSWVNSNPPANSLPND